MLDSNARAAAQDHHNQALEDISMRHLVTGLVQVVPVCAPGPAAKHYIRKQVCGTMQQHTDLYERQRTLRYYRFTMVQHYRKNLL